MLVQNVNLYQNNYSKKSNPNFTSIKSVRCDGLYKKYPELANDLIEALNKNPKAMEFCKKYDVNIVFYAVKQMQDSVESSLHIFFDNIAKSKFRKMFDKLAGNSEDKVLIHAWGNNYEISSSIKESTLNLIEAISPERKVADGYRGGLLDAHIENVEKNIEEKLKQKSLKKMENIKKQEDIQKAKLELNSNSLKLKKTIDDFISNGK